MKSQVTDTRRPRPVLENHGLAVVCVVAVIGCVACLLSLCGPAAVERRTAGDALLTPAASVAALRVYSVDGVASAWGLTHVTNKCSNISSPAITDETSNAAVKPEVVAIGIVAPIDHLLPNTILPLLREAVLVVRRAMAVGANVSNEMVRSNTPLAFARDAANIPVASTAANHFGRQHQERSDDVTRLNVFGAKASLLVSHDVTLPNRVALRLEPTGVTAPARLALFYDSASIFSMKGAA